MKLDWYIHRLRDGADSITALTTALDRETWTWRPDAEAWSILEIVNHLADEEVEDFRTRVRMTLADPDEPWPGIDPPAWVVDRGYQDRDPAASLLRFRTARAESLVWLASLEAPDWGNSYTHPLLGLITAADLLTSWQAHDMLHIRQIVRRLFDYAAGETGGGSQSYAGPW